MKMIKHLQDGGGVDARANGLEMETESKEELVSVGR